jgi:hypothetical protein
MATTKSELQEIFESNPDLVVRSYSGRGMFGKECLGVEVSSLKEMFISVLIALSERDDQDTTDLQEDFESMKTDSLGRGMIVYFERVPFVSDEDEDEDEGIQVVKCVPKEFSDLVP